MTTDFQNDTALWRLAKQDDRAAYEALYNRYVNLIYIEIHKRIGHQPEAEDLTQDLFLTLWEKRRDINIEGRFFSYLYRAAQNRVFNYFRDRKIPAKHIEAWESLEEYTGTLIETPAVFKHDELLQMEGMADEALQQLPLKMRKVYELRYEQKMTPQEISQQLVISPNTVHNHLKEVRKRFVNAIRKASLFLSSFL